MVSRAIQQLMPDHETAPNALLSGKRAMIGLWGDTAEDDRARALDIMREIEAEAWRIGAGGFCRRVSGNGCSSAAR